MNQNLKKLDFVETQAATLKSRIDRMLQHSNTTLVVGKDGISITFCKKDVKNIHKLSLPIQIGNLKIGVAIRK